MTLVVETGSASSSAESYASVSDADLYQASRGRTLWDTMTENEKEQALSRGTDWMLQEYRGRWSGDRVSGDQALDWPRVGAVDVDGFSIASDAVPKEVVRACIEIAWRAAHGELLPDQTTPVKSKSVGPVTVTYADGGRQAPKYPTIDAIVRPLLKTAGGIRLVRA